jgi:uncharacterized protein (TIGR02001 family)
MKKTSFLKALAVASIASAVPSLAIAQEEESPFSFGFGAALTTDYISRGITQTDHGIALQGWGEVGLYDFYVNVWASNVDLPPDDIEIDLAIGWRPTLGPVSLDIGYVRYFYPDSGLSLGEAYLKAGADLSETVHIGGSFFIDPDSDATYVEGNASLALPHDFGISGAVGFVNGGTDWTVWNVGAFWTWNDKVTVDVRYWDSNLTPGTCPGIAADSCDARVVGTISFAY